MSGQFHFDAASYLARVRAEVPDYDTVQGSIAASSAAVDAKRILDLGSGTGVTAAAVLARHPGATLVGIDESEAMLAHARRAVPGAVFTVARLEHPLPAGPFDLVVSAFAIHHLDGPGKEDLFARVASALRHGGLFVFGDVVVPENRADHVTPVDDAHDHPSSVDDQLRWLHAAGLDPVVVWRRRDLAVVRAVRTKVADDHV